MRTSALILMLMLTVLTSHLAAASSVRELKNEVDHKLGRYQAKGELTGRQIITFKERAKAIAQNKEAVLEKQQNLAKLSWQIDQARKAARTANSRLKWW